MTLKYDLCSMIKILTVTIVTMFAITLTSSAFAQTDDKMMMDGTPLSGPINIGGLFPLTGDISSTGIQIHAAAELAVEDFNTYLEETGAQWWLVLSSEDTATNPTIALEKIQSLNARGISNIIGPATSGNIQNIKGYADSNNMLVMSCCSTAPSLAISGDSIYRFVPDDKNQGNALGKILARDDIKALVPVWRGDAYGDDLRDEVAANFESRGGEVHAGVRYAPDTPELSLEMDLLAKYVQEMSDKHGAENVAIFVIAFDEITRLVQSASQHPILGDVSWYGTESTADSAELINDRIASAFTDKVSYTAMRILLSSGPDRESVQDRLTEQLGAEPTAFAYPAYDSVWVLGKAIMTANSADSTYIKSVLYDVAATHSSATGSTALNDAGDLAVAHYQVLRIEDGAWISTDKYSAIRDLLIPSNDLTGEVTVGSLYPLTGRSSSTGYATREATDLGAEDFNKFLQSINEEWHLNVISEDSTSLPPIALEKVQGLLAKGIDIVIGPRPSGEVTQVKSYADTNNMMIISCCSTAPTLAIANDSIFRIAVDDIHQGAGVSKLLEVEGIKAVVPIWLGDAYGDGLVNEVKDRAESRGYVVSDGIRYEPLLADFAVSVSELADQVQALVDEYGADKVAVFMTSFDESVPIMQAAARYDILNEIRWFGSETFVPKTNILDDPITSDLVKSIQFTAMRPADVNTGTHHHVQEHFLEVHGEIPTGYIYSAYDATWLVGLSMLQSGATDAGTIKTVFHDVASTYVGASGNTILNEAGDLVPRNYAIWIIDEDGWMLTERQFNPIDDDIS
ncbi:MAG: ABC transporter substrate-binding protein [Cenarchaeum sp. SB0661_bin_35]|nr:ABC transporter substrate-binding protein [Cenarchaeum sp. SB0667_bin_13]MXZ93831.1 ABC transporter substrate-binding protein [Cenarchaeum sp. SB0666_bin_15]MYB46392.1 ABC transporter substrate-binding protein [Cenarchaeum sp. SB0662_bin_33]MYC79149.1 ABC transporter substrate-binding protein [Cenarchaeum sp. SB0661_bin_35]MYI52051.1 ABC transporter substrate-binding protein [Cenarchaeum sp. SB0673_bin_9]